LKRIHLARCIVSIIRKRHGCQDHDEKTAGTIKQRDRDEHQTTGGAGGFCARRDESRARRISSALHLQNATADAWRPISVAFETTAVTDGF